MFELGASSPLSRLAYLYAALEKGGTAPTPPFWSKDERADRKAQNMAEHMHEMPPQIRSQLILMLRARTAAVPWAAIHWSWLGHIIRDWSPQWRHWALETFPAPVRSRLQKAVADSVNVVEGHPPAWWTAWFSEHAKARLKYPDTPPWDKEPSFLLQLLTDVEDSDLKMILRAHGTFGLVACMRKLPRQEAQQLLWQIPLNIQPLAAEIVQNKKWVEDEFWPLVYEEMKGAHPALKDRLIWMALADWFRALRQTAAAADLRRFACRLPRLLGEWVSRRIEAPEPPEWSRVPLQPDADSWKLRVEDLLCVLAARGLLKKSKPKGKHEGKTTVRADSE